MIDPNVPDFKRLFESAPGLFLVLEPSPDFRILGASDAYLKATHTERERIIGQALFDIFPDDPDDPEATGTRNLRASLDRVLATKGPDVMAVQRYDVRRPESGGGGFERRFWSPVNSPVPAPTGEIAYIIHRVEDVTEFVAAVDQHQVSLELVDELKHREASARLEILQRTTELDRVNHELRLALQQAGAREAALEAAKELVDRVRTHYGNLFDTVREALVVLDRDLRVKSANRSFYLQFGTEPEMTEGRLLHELGVGQWDLPPLRARIQEVLTERHDFRDFEITFESPAGPRVLLLNGRRTFRPGNDSDLVLLAIEDVTERKQGEEARERFFRLSEDLLCIAGADGYFKRINPAWERVLGYSMAELLASHRPSFIHPDDRESSAAAAARLAPGTPLIGFENRYRCRDGSYRWLMWNVASSGDGRLQYGIARDITEQKAAEVALRQAHAALEHRFALAIRTSAQMLYELDLAAGTASYANDEALGFPSGALAGGITRWLDLIHPDDRPTFAAAMERAGEGDATYHLEFRLRRPDGRYFPVESRGGFTRRPSDNAVIALGFVADISERKTLEQQFRQAQKMEAIGTLAGGIAHDFNNLIGVIVGYCDLLGDRLGRDENSRRHLGEIRKAGESAADLTRQLLTFGRKRITEPRVLHPGAIVSELSTMLCRLVGEHIKVDTLVHSDSGHVMADRGQLEQIIVNLAVNARDAMPDGGLLSIRVENTALDESYAKLHPEVVPGRYLKLTVGDTGVGMDAATQQRMFEPFFTTKTTGTGLGLATVYGIVKQGGGCVNVYSEPGRGTAFRIYLPRVDAEAGVADGSIEPTEPPGGQEVILLAEDSAPLRTVAREFLQRAGYLVLEATDGAEAVRMAGEAPMTIDLLLTDVVMPEMTGTVVAERVKPYHPAVRVLYMSGYADNQIVHHGEIKPGLTLLQKPFTRNGLLRMVRKVLDSPPPPGA